MIYKEETRIFRMLQKIALYVGAFGSKKMGSQEGGNDTVVKTANMSG
jgi:hypothetical protein